MSHKGKDREVKIINAHGRYGAGIYDEAKRAGIGLALACALVEQESGFRNIFGGDYGPAYRGRPPFYEERVTKAKVHELLGQSLNNGVGLTQLTSRGYVIEAENLGGAHLARNQLRVGFQLLAGLIKSLGKHNGIGAYNGGPGNPVDSYARSVEAKERTWETRLR